jgi:hypothetical protein
MIRLNRIVEEITEAGKIENPYLWNYDFEDDDGNIFYSFSTPKHTYSVAFTPQGVDRYQLFFNTEGNMGQDTEEGVALRVLSTVSQIANNFIKERQPIEVIFSPIKTKGTEDSRRFNVYKLYLEKNLPSDYKLLTIDNTFHLMKK